ncbi:MAG: 3-deoxy-manno-octulosonate cytidylyltransferase [Candidatus Goldbacteria bacterium]|nr:3-deoxy-manno-octulosonate cytidylyltransferase [Candidatus Goldiibacteriota bacterium]
MNIIGIIPARLKSTRLKEKMLIRVNGKTIIEHTFLNVRKSKLIKKLYVATDDDKIKKVIEKIGGSVILTSSKCKSGTERIREALKTTNANINDIVINIQGDEPLLESRFIDKAIKTLMNEKSCDVVTLATPFTDFKEINNPNFVKVVVDCDNNALYFSRALIPFSRDGKYKKGDILKHIGIYVFRKGILDKWLNLKSKYEEIEKLEQLRLIENLCRVKVVIVKSKSMSIDTAEDLKKFKKFLKKKRNG